MRRDSAVQEHPGIHSLTDLLEGKQFCTGPGALDFRSKVCRETQKPFRSAQQVLHDRGLRYPREQRQACRGGFAVIVLRKQGCFGHQFARPDTLEHQGRTIHVSAQHLDAAFPYDVKEPDGFAGAEEPLAVLKRDLPIGIREKLGDVVRRHDPDHVTGGPLRSSMPA